MSTQQSSHEWIGRFSVRLMHLWPALTFRTAVRLAVTSYSHAGRWGPELAADVYTKIRCETMRRNSSDKAAAATRQAVEAARGRQPEVIHRPRNIEPLLEQCRVEPMFEQATFERSPFEQATTEQPNIERPILELVGAAPEPSPTRRPFAPVLVRRTREPAVDQAALDATRKTSEPALARKAFEPAPARNAYDPAPARRSFEPALARRSFEPALARVRVSVG